MTKAWDHGGKSAHERGYGARWKKLRKRILARDKYLCQYCKDEGRITPATQVDHRQPKAKGGSDDPDNLASTCAPCHQAKTIRENGGRPRIVFGADGWPIEGGGR